MDTCQHYYCASKIRILTLYHHTSSVATFPFRYLWYRKYKSTESSIHIAVTSQLSSARIFAISFRMKPRDIKSSSENAVSSSPQLETILKSKFLGYVSRVVFLALSERKSGCGKVHEGDWWTTSRDWGWCTVTRVNNNGHIRVCISGRWAPSGCELRGWINRVET